jgi:hypothetical protein
LHSRRNYEQIKFKKSFLPFSSKSFVFLLLPENIRAGIYSTKGKGKGKAVPLQAWTGPQGSRRLRLPDF